MTRRHEPPSDSLRSFSLASCTPNASFGSAPAENPSSSMQQLGLSASKTCRGAAAGSDLSTKLHLGSASIGLFGVMLCILEHPRSDGVVELGLQPVRPQDADLHPAAMSPWSSPALCLLSHRIRTNDPRCVTLPHQFTQSGMLSSAEYSPRPPIFCLRMLPHPFESCQSSRRRLRPIRMHSLEEMHCPCPLRNRMNADTRRIPALSTFVLNHVFRRHFYSCCGGCAPCDASGATLQRQQAEPSRAIRKTASQRRRFGHQLLFVLCIMSPRCCSC